MKNKEEIFQADDIHVNRVRINRKLIIRFRQESILHWKNLRTGSSMIRVGQHELDAGKLSNVLAVKFQISSKLMLLSR